MNGMPPPLALGSRTFGQIGQSANGARQTCRTYGRHNAVDVRKRGIESRINDGLV